MISNNHEKAILNIHRPYRLMHKPCEAQSSEMNKRLMMITTNEAKAALSEQWWFKRTYELHTFTSASNICSRPACNYNNVLSFYQLVYKTGTSEPGVEWEHQCQMKISIKVGAQKYLDLLIQIQWVIIPGLSRPSQIKNMELLFHSVFWKKSLPTLVNINKCLTITHIRAGVYSTTSSVGKHVCWNWYTELSALCQWRDNSKMAISWWVVMISRHKCIIIMPCMTYGLKTILGVILSPPTTSLRWVLQCEMWCNLELL